MKSRKFTLENILKYREHLEKEQISRFREALKRENIIEKELTKCREDLDRLRRQKDNLLTKPKIDINKLKSLQEEILFSELDESSLEQSLIKAKNETENERLKWITKKSEKDAIKKLKEKHVKVVERELLTGEQKEIDDIAIQKHKNKEDEN